MSDPSDDTPIGSRAESLQRLRPDGLDQPAVDPLELLEEAIQDIAAALQRVSRSVRLLRNQRAAKEEGGS